MKFVYGCFYASYEDEELAFANKQRHVIDVRKHAQEYVGQRICLGSKHGYRFIGFVDKVWAESNGSLHMTGRVKDDEVKHLHDLIMHPTYFAVRDVDDDGIRWTSMGMATLLLDTSEMPILFRQCKLKVYDIHSKLFN